MNRLKKHVTVSNVIAVSIGIALTVIDQVVENLADNGNHQAAVANLGMKILAVVMMVAFIVFAELSPREPDTSSSR